MSPIVQSESVSRFYGIILGLNNVSFTVGPGITGVVGPNGAGKTTLFRLITGQIQPSSGDLGVFGERPWNNPAVKARIGYCPESEEVPSGLRPVEWLQGLGMISGFSASQARARSGEALERARLPREHWGKPLTAFSKGMRQRVKLAQCLLHDPDLVVLDEPMNGLDPMGRDDFMQALRELASAGKSLIISSHILHDLETLCGAFLILRGGRIQVAPNQAGTPGARERLPGATTFRCESPEALARFFFGKGLVRGCDIDADTGVLEVRWSAPDRFHGDFDGILLESGVRIYEVRGSGGGLEKAIEAPPFI